MLFHSTVQAITLDTTSSTGGGKYRITHFYMILLLPCEDGPATYINKFFQNYICYLNILFKSVNFF